MRRPPPTRFLRVLPAAAIALIVGGLLTACNPLTTPLPGAYSTVDAVADSLNLSDQGDILRENRYGGAFLGDSPTYVAVVGGAEAAQGLKGVLEEADYLQISDGDQQPTWSGFYEDSEIRIVLQTLEPGDIASLGNDGYAVDVDAVVIWIESK